MKVKIDAVLAGLDGKPVMIDPRNPKGATLQDVLVLVFQTEIPALDGRKGFADKLALYEKAKGYKAAKGSELDMVVEEIAEAKERIGALCPPQVVGAVSEVLPK